MSLLQQINFIIIIVVVVALYGCRAQGDTLSSQYPANVGDHVFDAATDTAEFSVCNDERVGQYYQFGSGPMFENEKPALLQQFGSIAPDSKQFNGYIVIRFIVNCEGKTGRFRTQVVDFDLKEVNVKSNLPQNLVTTISNIKGWGVPSDGKTSYDYYQYLTFKIIDGQVREILP